MMEAIQNPKNRLRGVRKEMNVLGAATLGRFVLGFVFSYAVYLIAWAVIGAPHILVFRGGLLNFAATTAKLKSSVSNFTFLYPMILLVGTILIDTVPFLCAAKKLKLHVKSFFAKPQMKAGSVLVFGFVSLGVSVCAAIFINVISLILKLFKIYLTTPNFSIPLKSPLSAAAMIIAIVIAGPVAEEFMFRGVMLNVLKKYGSAFAVICSSLIWALMHGNLMQAVPVFCMGLVFGVLALKANSIVPSILIHMANNLIALLGMLAKQSGSVYIVMLLGAINIMLLITAIPLFCVYYRQFFISGSNRNGKALKHIGAKAFFTSVPILLAIVIYSGYIITSVIPISFTF